MSNIGSDPYPEERPERCWCFCVGGGPNVQLLFIKVILRAVLVTVGTCLASKKSHSEIYSAYIFRAWNGESHCKHIASAMISLRKNRTYLCRVPQLFATSCKCLVLTSFLGKSSRFDSTYVLYRLKCGKELLALFPPPISTPFLHIDLL